MRQRFDFFSRSNQPVLDGCCFAISFAAAYPIRLEAWPAGADLRQLLIWLPILVAARLAVHWTRGIYRQVWKFVSFSEAIEIAKSILIVTGMLALLRFGFPGKNSFTALVKIPASVIAIEGLFSFTFSMGIRALRRIQYRHPRRELRVEEVLGRERVEVIGFEEIAAMAYAGKRVLVTGGGGSIGSELVRQLLRLKPSRIAFLDKDENAIFELQQEISSSKPSVQAEPIVADVRDLNRLRAIFTDFRPHVVFHAAAHKHVPLMEMHPCEAVLNNVGGTQNVLDLCAASGVSRFVFISSDKAVNPANVMGATKRLGELLVQSAARKKDFSAACVRFGNVLGSRGSVVPLFSRQIASGGPVTVTHPEMARFFMTVREAVQLILCAGTLAHKGEIFVLDMGRPRKILDLAREMIWLSGVEPEKDIETRIAGPRPGEKLSEELVAENETPLPTRFEKISRIAARPSGQIFLARDTASLLRIARNNDRPQVFEFLSRMDLGFQSTPISTPASISRPRAATRLHPAANSSGNAIPIHRNV